MKKIIVLMFSMLIMMFTLVGCVKPYMKPVFDEISPSQTAFLIPLEGNVGDQGTFQSEEFLKNSMVATRRIERRQRWSQTGRFNHQGEWILSDKLIVVERKPVVREWTERKDTGTESTNQGIVAEGRDSIGFMARMNISAQIEEEDAPTFLYRYNNKPLEQIIDDEIRSMVSTTFVETVSDKNYDEIIKNRSAIMTKVRELVVPYFKERGITITVLGLEGEFTPLNSKIQESLDKKFTEERLSEAQAITNRRNIEQAEAEAEAIRIRQSIMQQTLQLKQLEIQEKFIEKWNGSVPQVVTDGNAMWNMEGLLNKGK